MFSRSRPWMVIALVTGFVLRLAFLLTTLHAPLMDDEPSYDELAWNVASGHGYSAGSGGSDRVPTAARGPGFVLPLAALYRLAGHTKAPVLMLQVLLDTLSIWLVWRIGLRVFANPALAIGGALLYAIYPPFIMMTGKVLTETFVNSTVLLAVFLGLEWAIGGRAACLPWSGVAVGVCALSKPQLAPLALLIAFAGCANLASRKFWLAAALQVVIVTAVLTPWIVRNAVTFHAFIPGVTMGGVTFWGGTGPANGLSIGGLGDPHTPSHVTAAVRGMSELDRDRWLYREGIRVIRSAPERFLFMMFKKFFRLWFNLMHDARPSRASLAIATFNAWALGLCVWSLWRLRPPKAAVWLLVGMFAYFSLVHMLFFSVVRYSMPCFAYILPFTGAAALTILGAGGTRSGPVGALPSALHPLERS